jgi:dimethylamine--corrinoid protein Co-methyltransferase
MAAAMGDMRTAGDLVACMQMTRRMKIAEAKQYVAEKLGLNIIDQTNEELMRQVREDLDIGVITAIAGGSKGIAELLDIQINSVNLFKTKLSH